MKPSNKTNKHNSKLKEELKMKVKAIITAVAGIIGSVVLLGNFAGCSLMKEKELVTSYVDFGSHTASVQLDVSDGWTCEKANGQVLIYDHDKDTNSTVTATTKFVDKATFDRAKSEANRDMFSQEHNGGVIFRKQGTSDIVYLYNTGDTYVGIVAKNSSPEQMKKIVSHLTLTQVR
jgi:hypothetical protein